MKNIILSADGDSILYSVPDTVADNLERYCMEFCGKMRRYDEQDFIDYLNKYKFPNEKSVFVKNLGWVGFGKELPAEYASLPYFNF